MVPPFDADVPLKVGPFTLKKLLPSVEISGNAIARFFNLPGIYLVAGSEISFGYSEIRPDGSPVPMSFEQYQKSVHGRIGDAYIWLLLLVVPALAFAGGIPAAVVLSALAVAVYLFARSYVARQAVLLYQLNSSEEAAFTDMADQFVRLAKSGAWALGKCTTAPGSGKAAIVVADSPKSSTRIEKGLPNRVRSAFKFPVIRLEKADLFFAPDALYHQTKGSLKVIPYPSLLASTSTIHFRDEGFVPSGARVVGKTWKHVTKAGVADRRFSSNPEFPTVLYDRLLIQASGVLDTVLISAEAARLMSLASALVAMRSRLPPAVLGLEGAHPESLDPEPKIAASEAFANSQIPRNIGKPALSVTVSPSVRAAETTVVSSPALGLSATEASPHKTLHHLAEDMPTEPDLERFLLEEFDPKIERIAGVSAVPSVREHIVLPEQPERARWVGNGEPCQIAGLDIPGGLLFVGTAGRRSNGAPDPGVIDPVAPVKRTAIAISHANMGYYPSYLSITPEARRGYLQWLILGRRSPEADIGYVFLFYYGLERRALKETAKMLDTPGELKAIIDEVAVLVEVYKHESSFVRYASEFLVYLRSLNPEWRGYREEPLLAPGFLSVPLPIAVALGQLANDKVAMNAEWALRWARGAFTINKRTPAMRCAAQFDKLFTLRFEREFPKGYVLGINKTKLKFEYRAASAAYAGRSFPMGGEPIPDVTGLTRHLNKLQSLVDDCTQQLDAYSRAVGRAGTKPLSLASRLLLPREVWPADLVDMLNAIKDGVGDDPMLSTPTDLFKRLGVSVPFQKDDVSAVTEALGYIGVGIEPAIAVALKVAKDDAKICLFRTTPGSFVEPLPAAYDVAKVTLSLASVVATVDGTTAATENDYLIAQVKAWPDLTDAQHQRLHAHLCVSLIQPPTIQCATKRLAGLEPDFGRKICQLMCSLAIADGVVTAGERRVLSKIYAALSQLPSSVEDDLTALGYKSPSVPGKLVPTSVHGTDLADGRTKPSISVVPSLALDTARIAQIMLETEQVSGLLAQVFEADLDEASEGDLAPVVAIQDEHGVGDTELVMGLDAAHSDFVRHLLTRGSWSRDELQSIAGTAGLMLNGVLEKINDACFDHLDCALVDGDDPIEVYLDLRDQIL